MAQQESDLVRVAMIGAGGMANNVHYPSLASFPDVRFAGICDLDESRLAEKHGVITQVSHQRRSAPILVKMREECLKRGPITHAVCEFYKCEPEPHYTARDHMMDDCTHAIDTVRWMCGGEVEDLDSHCRRIGTPDINWIGAMLRQRRHRIRDQQLVQQPARFSSRCTPPRCTSTPRWRAWPTCTRTATTRGSYATEDVAGSHERFVYGGFQAKNREFIDSLKSGREVTGSPFRDWSRPWTSRRSWPSPRWRRNRQRLDDRGQRHPDRRAAAVSTAKDLAAYYAAVGPRPGCVPTRSNCSQGDGGRASCRASTLAAWEQFRGVAPASAGGDRDRFHRCGRASPAPGCRSARLIPGGRPRGRRGCARCDLIALPETWMGQATTTPRSWPVRPSP